MATLQNYRKSLVSGQVVGNICGSYPVCVDATPATSYNLAQATYCGYYMGQRNIACSGIILNGTGFDKFELNAYGVGSGIDYDYYNRPYSFTIYVGAADNIGDIFSLIYQSNTQGYALLPITRKYLKIWGSISYGTPYRDVQIGLSQTSLIKKISAIIKIPQKYPVYNAIVNVVDSDDGTILGTLTTGTDGKTGQLDVDIIDRPNIKIWAQKSINKSLLNITAKDISLLKEINVDT